MVRMGREAKRPRVVIVGGGFGGLAAAKALGKAPVEVILIDRTNHSVFAPLLYQVATSSTRAVANQFPNPRDSAKAEEYHRDHGRGHWRGQGRSAASL